MLTEHEALDLEAAISYCRHCENTLTAFRHIREILEQLKLANARAQELERQKVSIKEEIDKLLGEKEAIAQEIEAEKEILKAERKRTREYVAEQERIREKKAAEVIAAIEEEKAKALSEFHERMEALKELEDKKREELDLLDQEYRLRKERLEKILSQLQ